MYFVVSFGVLRSQKRSPCFVRSIKEAVSQKAQLAADLATHKQDRSDAQAAWPAPATHANALQKPGGGSPS